MWSNARISLPNPSTRILPSTHSRRVTTCAVKARWCLDIRYGVKMEAVSLLQEWVREIGSEAGLTAANTTINSGAVGSPESRLELEITLDSLAELEQFWALIPPVEHKSWSQKMQSMIVDGSPQWEVYRTVDAFPGQLPSLGLGAVSSPKITTTTASKPSSPSIVDTAKNSGGLVMASGDEVDKYGEKVDDGEVAVPSTAETTASGLSIVSSGEEADVILDWKGDPMKINPGDKLPFKF